MKNLVLYYSWTGNTEVVAKVTHQVVGGDLAGIEEVKQRKPGIGFGVAAFSALIGAKSKLKPMDLSLKGYNNIYLCSQVWASRSTPAINTFLNEADLKGKNVYLLLTLGDDKAPEKVFASMARRIEKRGGKVVSKLHVMTFMGKTISPDAVKGLITDWVQKG